MMRSEPYMQTTYQVTCKCGHIFPIPAQFLSTDEDERAALLKALEGLMCPDCIQDAIDRIHALREHLLKITAVPPVLPETLPKDLHQPLECPDESPYTRDYERPFDIMDVGWRTLAKGPLAFEGEPYPPIPKEAYAILHAIDAWNRDYPVGTEVYVNPTDGEKVSDPCTHRTTSPAKLLAGKPVVEVSGLGPIDLDRLVPIGT